MTETGPCSRCLHFRRVRPASQLLAAGMETTGPELASALAKIVEDERKLQDAEFEVKKTQGFADRDRWPARPMMSDFCGRHEAEDIYLIAEVKNRGQLCGEFEAGSPERHACIDCRHRVLAKGGAADYEAEQFYAKSISDGLAVGASISQPEAHLTEYRSGVAARKALELSGAYAGQGRLLSDPEYLDYCARFSSADEHVVCVLQNPHNTCREWEAATAAPEVAPTAVSSAEPVAFQQTQSSADAAREVLPVQDTLLSEGPPPLYASAADASIDLIDFLAAAVRGVDLIDVTPAVRASWQSYLATFYMSMQIEDRNWFVDAPRALAEITSVWAQASDLDRRTIGQELAPFTWQLLQFADPVLSRARPQQALDTPPPAPNTPEATYAPQYGYAAGDTPSQMVNQVILEGQRRVEEAPTAALAAQEKIYQEEIATTMLTNLASSRHSTLMEIARGFKG